MNELAGKTAIVTGGSGGIGRATVDLFAAEGAKVVIADLVEPDFEVADTVAFHRTDVTDRESVQALVDFTVERFGGLDVMFNNAGVTGAPRRFLKDDLRDFQQVFAVDLLGIMLGAQIAARHMAEHGGGVILNTTSLAGITPGAGFIAYRSAKAGVVHLTKCLAIELAEHGIRVNCIAPANIATPINAQFDISRTIELTQPLQRAGTPADAAQAALYLASDRAAQLTGVILPVDGGTSVGPPVARTREIMDTKR